MSALLPKADMAERQSDVCFVPKADIRLSLPRSVELIVQPGAKDGVGEMGVRGDPGGRSNGGRYSARLPSGRSTTTTLPMLARIISFEILLLAAGCSLLVGIAHWF
jgi:hypothetical protein